MPCPRAERLNAVLSPYVMSRAKYFPIRPQLTESIYFIWLLPFAFVTLYYLTLECAAFSGPARAITCGPHISRTLGFLPSDPTWFMIRLLFYLFKPYLTYISLFSDSSTPDSNKLLRVINLNKYIWIHQNNSSWLAI